MTGQHGGVSTELAVLTPVLMVLLLFVVYGGRLAQAQHDVAQATAEAARQATMQRSGSVDAAARAVVVDNLDAAGVSCVGLRTAVRGDPRPGGSIDVTATCTVDLHGVATLGLPAHATVTASATQVVDAYRSDRP